MIFSAVFADCHSCHLCALLCHRDTTVSPILLKATTSRLTSALLRAAGALGRAGCWPTPWPRRCFAGTRASQHGKPQPGEYTPLPLRRDRRRRSRRAPRVVALGTGTKSARVEPVSPGEALSDRTRRSSRDARSCGSCTTSSSARRRTTATARRNETRPTRTRPLEACPSWSGSRRRRRRRRRFASAAAFASTCTPRSPRAATPRYSISRMRARPRAWRRRTARRRTARRRRSAFRMRSRGKRPLSRRAANKRAKTSSGGPAPAPARVPVRFFCGATGAKVFESCEVSVQGSRGVASTPSAASRGNASARAV